MENSSRFFCNKECEYFPCHAGVNPERFNCLFCYCPMNYYDDCLGNPEFFTLENGIRVKDCSHCLFPHNPDHYDAIMEFLQEKLSNKM